MEKIFIFVAGLPATGKDFVAQYFIEKQFTKLTYSSMILKPIVENTEENLKEFIYDSLPEIKNNLETEQIIIEYIERIKNLKRNYSNRELYIKLGVFYLPELIKKLSKNKYTHPILFGKKIFNKNDKIVIAGFRMKEELDTLLAMYPNVKIIKILLETKDEIRYSRIINRDNIKDKERIIKEDLYEKETSYKKLIECVNFNYTLKNENSENTLTKELDKIINEI